MRPHRRQPTRLPCPWDSPGKNTGVGCHFLLQCMKEKSESEAAQSCLTLSDPMDRNLPASSVHGIFQARVLEWGPIAFSPFPLNHRLICPCKKCDSEVLCIWPITSILKQMHFRELKKKKKKNLEYLLEEVLIKGRWPEAGSQNQAKYIPHGKLPTKGNNWSSKHIFISLRHRSNSTVFSSH